MTDDVNQAETETAVPPAPATDAFSFVVNMLDKLFTATADPRAAQAWLAELQAKIDAAERAVRKLEHVREGHDRAVARDREEIEKERKDLAQRYGIVREAEARLEVTKQRVAEFNRQQAAHRDARQFDQLPGGGVRDFGEDGMYREDAPRPRDDPHFDTRPAAPADEMEVEAAPDRPAGSNLTRSRPRRRVQPEA